MKDVKNKPARERRISSYWRGYASRLRFSRLKVNSDRAHFGQWKTVEVARVGRGISAGVGDVDEIAFLHVVGEHLLAHADVNRVAGRAGNHPWNRRAATVGDDVVAQP